MSASAKRVERPRLLRPPHLHDGRYPYIDSLRAMAALSIVVFHFAGYMTLPEQMEWLRPLVVRLGTGVLVFFVISGFLIYRPFVRANLMGTPRPEVIAYAKRRFLRIVPAYFLALTVTAALVGKTDVFGPDGFLYFGFLQIYQSGMELKGLSVAWSLCIEVTLYAFLPIWAAIVALVPARNAQERNAREAFMLIVLLVGGVLIRVLLTNSQGRVDSVSILGYLDIFALGMVLAYWSVAWENRPVPRWLSWINPYPGISWLIAGICLWAMATQTGPSQSAFQAASGTDLWLRHVLAAGVGVFLVLPVAFGDQTKGVLRRVLSNSILLWAGVVSYGIYLFHPVVLRKVDDAGLMPETSTIANWWGMLVAICVITSGVAALSWHFLERPMLELKNKPLLSSDRSQLPLGARIAIAIGGAALVLAGLDGSGYEFIDFVLVLSGLAIVLGALVPRDRPRPAAGLLAAIGAVALVFSLVPGVLELTTKSGSASAASSSPFPQRAFLVGVSSNGKVSLFLNGKKVASVDGPANAAASMQPFEIGGVKGSKGWNGSLDAVAVWKGGLSGDQIRKQYEAGARSGGSGLAPVVKDAPGLVRWYPLGDTAQGPKDEVSGRRAAKVGRVAQTTGHVAIGDTDGGGAKLVGDGRLSSAPLTGVKLSDMTVAIWVQNGNEISNRAIMGAENAWLMKTDPGGHWSFGVKDGAKGYTAVAPQAAQRFVPGAAQQAKKIESQGVSVAGILGALFVLCVALMAVTPVRRRVFALINSVSAKR
ncbi:MAG: acyltransferase family protein [Actinomycetes bacterium]